MNKTKVPGSEITTCESQLVLRSWDRYVRIISEAGMNEKVLVSAMSTKSLPSDLGACTNRHRSLRTFVSLTSRFYNISQNTCL